MSATCRHLTGLVTAIAPTLLSMADKGWSAIGRIAKARRERLGLKQDELALYGGPGVATVGKFERAAQASFPTRTQHQVENALGWSRTIVEQVVKSINDGSLTEEDWWHDLVEEEVPDLSRPAAPSSGTEVDEALGAIRSVLRLLEVEKLDDAVRRALLAILPLLSVEGATKLGQGLRTAFPPGDQGGFEEVATPLSAVAAHDADETDQEPGAPEDES